MHQPSLQPDPWLDSEAARRIGPVTAVHGPTAGMVSGLVTLTGIVGGVFLPVWLAPLGLLVLAKGWPDWTYLFGDLRHLMGAAVGIGSYLALTSFFVVPLVVMIRDGRRALAIRLLVGARGLAHWSPTEEQVFLWDDLGTGWVCHPTFDPEGIQLRQANGSIVVIDRAFADHQKIISRVVAEVVRLMDRPGTPGEPGRQSEAIRLNEPGIVQPRE